MRSASNMYYGSGPAPRLRMRAWRTSARGQTGRVSRVHYELGRLRCFFGGKWGRGSGGFLSLADPRGTKTGQRHPRDRVFVEPGMRRDRRHDIKGSPTPRFWHPRWRADICWRPEASETLSESSRTLCHRERRITYVKRSSPYCEIPHQGAGILFGLSSSSTDRGNRGHGILKSCLYIFL